jgi:RNA polymerase sigma factor (sigma-70 family)
MLALNDALEELATFDKRKSQVVEMRFFGGLAAKDIADVLGTTEPTVRRDWNIARAWLYRRLQGEVE